jgi:hypothetical protein
MGISPAYELRVYQLVVSVDANAELAAYPDGVEVAAVAPVSGQAAVESWHVERALSIVPAPHAW